MRLPLAAVADVSSPVDRFCQTRARFLANFCRVVAMETIRPTRERHSSLPYFNDIVRRPAGHARTFRFELFRECVKFAQDDLVRREAVISDCIDAAEQNNTNEPENNYYPHPGLRRITRR